MTEPKHSIVRDFGNGGLDHRYCRKQIFMIVLPNKNWFLVLYYVLIICQGSMLYSLSGSMTPYSCFLYVCAVFVVSTASMDFSDYALSSSNTSSICIKFQISLRYNIFLFYIFTIFMSNLIDIVCKSFIGYYFSWYILI